MVLLYSGHIPCWAPAVLLCCVSLCICCFIACVLFSSFIILIRWLDSVKLHYAYLKSHQGSPDSLSILHIKPLWGIQAWSFSTAVWKAVSHYKGSSVEYKQEQQQSRQPVGVHAEIMINISVSKNCSVILLLMAMLMVLYCYPMYLSYKEMFS